MSEAEGPVLVGQDMMQFDQALVVMRENGDRVSRMAWCGSVILTMSRDDKIWADDGSDAELLWQPVHDDIVSEDWVIVSDGQAEGAGE